MSCLYCGSAGTSQEHVIPQSFGTFLGNTLTIQCVCQGCNNRLGRDLDEHLARNTYEGVRRYENGLLSGEPRVQKGISISMTKADNPQADYLSGAQSWIDGTRAKARFKPGVGLRLTKTKTFDWFTQETLKAATDLSQYDKIPIHFIGIPAEQLGAYVELLRARGFEITEAEIKPLPPLDPGGSALLHIEGTYSELTLRAFCKVLFEFMVSQFGCDEAAKSPWTNVRSYIANGQPLVRRRITDAPFWPKESQGFRFPADSYNLRVTNSNLGVIGAVQFFNIAKIELLLCPNYQLPSSCDARLTPGKLALINPSQIPSVLVEHRNPVELCKE